MGGQGDCEQRIEVFVKIQKKKLGGGGPGEGSGLGGGVRVDVNKKLKFLWGGVRVGLGGSGWM